MKREPALVGEGAHEGLVGVRIGAPQAVVDVQDGSREAEFAERVEEKDRVGATRDGHTEPAAGTQHIVPLECLRDDFPPIHVVFMVRRWALGFSLAAFSARKGAFLIDGKVLAPEQVPARGAGLGLVQSIDCGYEGVVAGRGFKRMGHGSPKANAAPLVDDHLFG